ncbi:hypothetical protein Tco_0212541 [Tanacetum coccineum]
MVVVVFFLLARANDTKLSLPLLRSIPSSSAPTDTKTISSIGGALGSPVFTPSSDDPYMLARHAYSPTASDTESEPFGDPLETEEA